jgi:acyl transferase domain-containing protein
MSNPSGKAQEQLIRDVYARANISPEDTGFIEAHGTGTKVGDPIEAGAIYRVFGSGRTKRFPLYMGSAKTNFGHLENASGVISIIKASLMLERGFILPNANFQRANDEIPLDEWNIRIPTSIRPWPKNKRFISVNNFGFGGSNSHAVLERPPRTVDDVAVGAEKEFPRLFVLCAGDDRAAKRIAPNLESISSNILRHSRSAS